MKVGLVYVTISVGFFFLYSALLDGAILNLDGLATLACATARYMGLIVLAG